MLTPPMCIGVSSFSTCRNDESIGTHPFHAAPCGVEQRGRAPGRPRGGRTSRSGSSRPRRLGVRVEAGTPVDDPVAARVHRRSPRRRRAAGRAQVLAEGRAALAVRRSVLENTRRDAEVAEPRHPPHGSQHRAARPPAPSRTGEPSITRRETISGLRTASERASAPPRLCPISNTGSPALGGERSQADPRGARTMRSAQSTLARIPLIADAMPAPAQPAAQHRQRGVARHEARDQQHRLRHPRGGAARADRRSASSRASSGCSAARPRAARPGDRCGGRLSGHHVT